MLNIRAILLVTVAGQLVTISAHTALYAADQPDAKDEPTAIFVMHSDGSQVRRLADVAGSPRLGAPRWSHDGKRLAFDAVGLNASTPRWFLINADGTGQREMGIGGHADWSPDDKQLLFAVSERAPVENGIWVQNVDGQGRQLLAADGHAPRWSPRDGEVALRNGASLEIIDLIDSTKRTVDAPSGVAAGFDWSPDGQQLAVVARGPGANELWIVDVAEHDKKRKRFSGDIDGHVAWSPDGKRLAIAQAKQIHVLNVAGSDAPVPIPGQQGNNSMPAWSSDGQWIAFASTRKTPGLAPVASKNRSMRLEEVKRHSRGNIVFGLDLSLDGRQVLLGGKRDLEIWNFDTDESSHLSLGGEWVALSPDGNTVAQCGPLIKIALGNLKSGKPIRDLHTGSMCTNVDFSPDGKRVVCGTIEKSAIVFDVAGGKRVSVFEKHNAPITRVAFLPNGAEVASNGQDKHVRIWNSDTAQQRLAIAHPEVVWGLAASPDGRFIATGTGGPTEGNPIMQRVLAGKEFVIRLWDSASGALVREMPGHTEVVYALTFTPDGRTLVSGGWDGTIRLWDVATGSELASVQGQGSVYAIAVTPDGSQLVVGGGEIRSASAPIRRFPNEQVRLYRIIDDEAAAQPASK